MYRDVLRAIKKGINKPTRILYRANLSWNPLMRILDSLTNQGFVTVEDHGKSTRYNITKKGNNVLEYVKEAFQLVNIE